MRRPLMGASCTSGKHLRPVGVFLLCVGKEFRARIGVRRKFKKVVTRIVAAHEAKISEQQFG